MSNDSRRAQTTSSQQGAELGRRIHIFKVIQWIWLLFGVLETLIAFRIGLKLIGANPDSLIVILVNGSTYLFLFPFTGLVGSPATGSMVLELSSMFAMWFYALIGWMMGITVWLIFYRPRGQIVSAIKLTTTDRHNPR